MSHPRRIRETLAKLSIRAILVFIVRLARRLQPKHALIPDISSEEIRAVDRAINTIDDASRKSISGYGWNAYLQIEWDVGLDVSTKSRDPVAVNLTKGLTEVVDVLIYAGKIFDIASEAVPEVAERPITTLLAADSDGEIEAACSADIPKLELLTDPSEFGDPIDSSPDGPLGALWPEVPPTWFLDGTQRLKSVCGESFSEDVPRGKDAIMREITEANAEALINICFDDASFTTDEIETFLCYVAETYRELGGRGLKVVSGETLLPKTVEVVQ